MLLLLLLLSDFSVNDVPPQRTGPSPQRNPSFLSGISLFVSMANVAQNFKLSQPPKEHEMVSVGLSVSKKEANR